MHLPDRSSLQHWDTWLLDHFTVMVESCRASAGAHVLLQKLLFCILALVLLPFSEKACLVQWLRGAFRILSKWIPWPQRSASVITKICYTAVKSPKWQTSKSASHTETRIHWINILHLNNVIACEQKSNEAASAKNNTYCNEITASVRRFCSLQVIQSCRTPVCRSLVRCQYVPARAAPSQLSMAHYAISLLRCRIPWLLWLKLFAYGQGATCVSLPFGHAQLGAISSSFISMPL